MFLWRRPSQYCFSRSRNKCFFSEILQPKKNNFAVYFTNYSNQFANEWNLQVLHDEKHFHYIVFKTYLQVSAEPFEPVLLWVSLGEDSTASKDRSELCLCFTECLFFQRVSIAIFDNSKKITILIHFPKVRLRNSLNSYYE